MTGQLAIGVVGLATTAWLARNLPTGELSVWPVCISLVTLAYVISNFGLRDTFVRMIPPLIVEGQRADAGNMLRTGLLLTFAGGLVLSGVVYVWAGGINALLLKGEVPTETVRLLALAVFWTTAAMHLEWFLNAFQEYKYMALSRAANNIVRPVAAVGLYWVAGIQGAVLGLTVGPILGCTLSLGALARHLRHATGFMAPTHLLRHSAPFYAASVSKGLLLRLDYVLIGALGGTTSLATYYVAFKIAEYLKHFDSHTLDTMTPKLGEAATDGGGASAHAFAVCSRYFFLGLVPLHLGLAGIGTALVVLYAGSQYVLAGPILSVLCVYLLSETFCGLYRQTVVVIGKRWSVFLLDSLQAASAVLFVGVLSVHLGGLGAALGLTVAVLTVLPLAIMLTRRIFTPVHSVHSAVIGVSGGVVAMSVLLTIQTLLQRPILTLAAFPIAAGLYLVMLRGRLIPDDMRLIAGLMPDRVRDSRMGKRMHAGLERYYVAGDDLRQSHQSMS